MDTSLSVRGRLDDLSGLGDILRELPEVDEARVNFLTHIEELLNASRKYPSIRNYTRNKHYVSTRSAATAATARLAGAVLWNPHATSRIQLFEWWFFITTAGAANPGLARATARGTATTSLAMAIANSIANDSAAPSGAVVDTVWSAAPTISAATLGQMNLAAAAGNGVIIPSPDPIDITPASGMAIITTQAVILPIADVTFVFGD